MSLATAMALARGAHLAAMMSLLGTTGFIVWVLPAARQRSQRALERLWRISGLAALLTGIVWFALQAAAIADADSFNQALDALPVVAMHTRYGVILTIRLGLLAVATMLAWADRGPAGLRGLGCLALAFAGAALGLQGMIGHAGATGGAIGYGLVLSEALHLLAAGIWLGALPPLWLCLRALSPAEASAVCERFSPIGMACVVVLAGTGLAQGLDLIGGFPALFGTSYGHVALLKIGLFLVALALAAANRFWLTDRLLIGLAQAQGRLLASVGLETCVGLGIVAAAAFMASCPPAAHSVPVWPFSWQLSLVTVNEDADFRREALFSLAAIGAAAMLMFAALLRRRLRLIGLAILALAVAACGPSLKLLVIEAYPTSFQVSPTAFAADSIVRGQQVFAQRCAVCHGSGSNGNGPAAATLRIKPADLTMPHVMAHSDGEMFWWLTHGIDDPEGGLAMPGFGAALSVDDRWASIDFVRAHNSAVAWQGGGDIDVLAPALPVTCLGIAATIMADLRGHVVHVVTMEPRDAEPLAQPGLAVVRLDLRHDALPQQGACVAADPAAWDAYAILADLAPSEMAGSEFLVDAGGWLRAMRHAESRWGAQGDLAAAIRAIGANPVKHSSGAEHEHHH